MENKNSTKHPSAYKIISIVVIVIWQYYLPSHYIDYHRFL